MRTKKARLPLRQPPRPLTSAAMSTVTPRSRAEQFAAASTPVRLTPPVRQRSFIRRYWAIGVVMLIGGLIAGCSALSSDTVRVVQSNADSTIAAMQTTMTAMQGNSDTLQLTAAQGVAYAADIATSAIQANQYSTQLSAAQTSTPPQAAPALGAQPPTSVAPVNSGSVAATAVPAAQAQSAAVTGAATVDANAITIDQAVLTKQINNQGCAVKPTTTFAMTDAKIYIVAQVHKLKKGTMFTANWSGTINHVDSWTADYNSPLLCIHFFVTPTAINMAPGAWTVALTAPDQPTQTLNFTIADNPVATAAATP